MFNKYTKLLSILMLALVVQASGAMKKQGGGASGATGDSGEKVMGRFYVYPFVNLKDAIDINHEHFRDYFEGLTSEQLDVYRQQAEEAKKRGENIFIMASECEFGSDYKKEFLIKNRFVGP